MKKSFVHPFYIIFTFALIMLGTNMFQSPVFAEETESQPGTDPLLDVYYDDILLRSFSEKDLNDIEIAEGSAGSDGQIQPKTYDYSAMNTYPNPSTSKNVTGPTVKAIIDIALQNRDAVSGGDGAGDDSSAAIPDSIDELDDDQVIDIAESGVRNAYHASYTVRQFLAERYYFPNIQNEQGRKGAPPLAVSSQGKVAVPAIISTYEPDDKAKKGRFLIGQLSPTEQNQPDWVQGVVSSTLRRGKITISSGSAEKWNPIIYADPVEEGNVFIGDAITFDTSANDYSSQGGKRYWIYYTTDGSEPTRYSSLYNFNNYDHGSPLEEFNKYVMQTEGTLTIKAKVFGSGRLDSETSVIEVNGVKGVYVSISGKSSEATYDGKPHEAISFDCSISKPNIAEVSLKDNIDESRLAKTEAGVYPMDLTQEDFDVALADPDYHVRWDIAQGTLTILPAAITVKTENAVSVYNGKPFTAGGTLKGLVNGETATLKTTGEITGPGIVPNRYEIIWDGTAKEKNYTVSEQIGTLTVLPAAPSTFSAKNISYKSNKVSWAPVFGADGYEVYRSAKSNSGYKLLKTVKGGSMISSTDTSAQTGTKYYYRVRAFTDASSGKIIFGSFSKTASACAVLKKPVISSLIKKGSSVKVKWKKVEGASGYKIYRSVKKSGKYSLVKTVSSGKTVSYKNTKLKKKKTYYYKIRAYRTVSGKKVYSSYSAVKKIKI